MTNVPRAELRNRAGGRRRVNSIRGRLKGFRDVSLSRDVNLRTYRPSTPIRISLSYPPRTVVDTLRQIASMTPPKPSRKTLSSSFSFRFSYRFLSFLPSFFFFLYLLPAERPRVINQIIRRVRLDFCLATFEFGSRGFDEGKDCCGGVDLPSFPPSSRHTGSFPLSFVHGEARCVAAW